jgi:hypothetical protein
MVIRFADGPHHTTMSSWVMGTITFLGEIWYSSVMVILHHTCVVGIEQLVDGHYTSFGDGPITQTSLPSPKRT